MMHENNRKSIENWKAKDYANAYWDYQNNWMFVRNWINSFMPEEIADIGEADEFLQICKNFHELGF